MRRGVMKIFLIYLVLTVKRSCKFDLLELTKSGIQFQTGKINPEQSDIWVSLHYLYRESYLVFKISFVFTAINLRFPNANAGKLQSTSPVGGWPCCSGRYISCNTISIHIPHTGDDFPFRPTGWCYSFLWRFFQITYIGLTK